MPAEKEVHRGSILNFEKEVDVIHPSLLSIHNIGKQTFKTNTMVLDFVGGNDIPNLDARRSDKVQAPCEILVFDGEGKLQLLDETDDAEGFRRYLPPKPEEAPTRPNGVGPPGAEGYPGGILEGGPGRQRQPPRARAKGGEG
jgi:hypothetical protein